MAIKCLNCNTILKGSSLPRVCSACGNKDLTKYIRVESEFTPKEQKQHNKDKAFLESRKA